MTILGLFDAVERATPDIASLSVAERAILTTRVECLLRRPVTRTVKSVFDAFTDDLEFTRTGTVVKLFGIGRDFVSRSEARRLLHRLDPRSVSRP